MDMGKKVLYHNIFRAGLAILLTLIMTYIYVYLLDTYSDYLFRNGTISDEVFALSIVYVVLFPYILGSAVNSIIDKRMYYKLYKSSGAKHSKEYYISILNGDHNEKIKKWWW